jgi:hypothetical protein
VWLKQFIIIKSQILNLFKKLLPSSIVKQLALLLHIQEVPGSNFSLETGYPDSGDTFVIFLSPSR